MKDVFWPIAWVIVGAKKNRRKAGFSPFNCLDEQADISFAAILEVGGCADIFDAVDEVGMIEAE